MLFDFDKQEERPGVVRSGELERILALPRRVLDLEKVPDVTPLFRRDGGSMCFWPIQSAALVEAAEANGLFAAIAVGCGKSLISYALPEAMNSKCAVLLVPANLKNKASREIPEYSKHFRLPVTSPGRVHVVAMTTLSSAKHADILDRLKPDLIIVDEMHMLAHPNAARTKRFLRYFRQNPHCRFAGMSGSITKKSLIDYAHLLELALRKNSPVPFGYHERLDWAGALDVKPREPRKPGALLRFCKGDETVRQGFRRRLVETLGVVATSENKLDTGLVIKTPINIAVPPEVEDALKKARKTWSVGDDEFDSVLALHRVLRQLACGFYYAWVPPVDPEWVEARKRWHREVRSYLTHSSRAGMDSPFLLAMAAAKGTWPAVTWPEWKKVKHIKPPEVEAIWISDFLVRAAVKWGQNKTGAIIWYSHVALGEAIAKAGGWPLYDGGTDAGMATPGKQPVIVCSMKAQGTGKNLQGSAEAPGYWKNLLTDIPGGLEFEQVIGRTHREGQSADDVEVSLFQHTQELRAAWSGVIEDSKYVQETTGNTYRILTATIE